MVAIKSPKIIATAIGSHMGPPPIRSGSSPEIVVTVVSTIGRHRLTADTTTALAGSRPFSLISIFILSRSTIALFITIPESEMIPRSVRNPK